VYRRSSVDVVSALWYSNQTKVVQYLDIYGIEVAPMTEESKVDMVGLGLDCRRDDTDPDS
jgi:hypothetical protein